ncbi:MAG TPA: DUF4351 domain-containing protein [Bryobacteraceae bacterium]|nr:DUF4351 domain-containing protein [Bryobacteraceae bacterium]
MAKRKGRQEGRKEGRREGLLEGVHLGELTMLGRLIGKRFGSFPACLEERLVRCTQSELEGISHRILDAQTLEDLVK